MVLQKEVLFLYAISIGIYHGYFTVLFLQSVVLWGAHDAIDFGDLLTI